MGSPMTAPSAYAAGAIKVTVVSPYVRPFDQARNRLESIGAAAKHPAVEDEAAVKLVASEDAAPSPPARSWNSRRRANPLPAPADVTFGDELDQTRGIHHREIRTNTCCGNILGRGLGIHQFICGATSTWRACCGSIRG